MFGLSLAPRLARAQVNGTANVCSPRTSADQANITKNQYGINNASTTASVEVICPILNGVPATFVAHVYPRNSTVALSCMLDLMDANGNIGWQQTQSVTGGPGSGVQSLTWTNAPSNTFPNAILDCVIPPIQAGAVSNLTWFGSK
jgi:hypothetical protein